MVPREKSLIERSVSELEAEVRRHNRLYFQRARPAISDEDFDRLVERLRVLNPDSPVLQEIGSDLLPSGKKIAHSSPMLSLDKCYNLDDLMKWVEKLNCEVAASPKIDGLAIAIRYDETGHLKVAETRGDGNKGDEITANLLRVTGVPARVSEANLEVRGEVYMPLSVFRDFKNTFANPRNLAAGAIKQKDPQKTADYALRFFAYELVGRDYETEQENEETLRKLGFQTVETHYVSPDRQALEKNYRSFLERRHVLDYEIDGVVYKASQVEVRNRLGASSHHPRWAIAYKFQGDSGVSFLREVEWSVSRTGVITPIGIVDPVVLSGATVSRISLHNAGMMGKLGVTLDAEVAVVRRGGVIPHLEKVLRKTSRAILLPERCPSCDFPTELRDDFLYCTNPLGCRQTKLGELKHFVDVLEIDGFGPKLIEQLYDSGYVEEVVDFFRLTPEMLLGLERVGPILAQKLVGHIQGRKNIPLGLFLQSLGIPDLGKQVSQLLVKHFRNFEALSQATEEDLAHIPTVGPIIARHVVVGLLHKKKMLLRLLKEIHLEEKANARAGQFSGKNFLFTGKMASMSRGEAEKLVEAEGGEIASGVSKDLDFLVIGSEGYRNREKGQKWLKAESLVQKGAALKIISEEEFLTMLP